MGILPLSAALVGRLYGVVSLLSKEKRWQGWESNPRPRAYESPALPLSYPAGDKNSSIGHSTRQTLIRSVTRPLASSSVADDADWKISSLRTHAQQAVRDYSVLYLNESVSNSGQSSPLNLPDESLCSDKIVDRTGYGYSVS